MDDHSGASIAHHGLDFLSHFGSVAVGWAFFAGCFSDTIGAVAESFLGILLQFQTLVAEVVWAMVGSAIAFDHLSHHPTFSFDSFHLLGIKV